MRNYATLFDSKFLPQGLALYESIRKHSSEPFTLWVLAMDEECRQHIIWLKNRLDYLISSQSYLVECSPNRFAALRQSRTHQEYCWTCASQFTEYVLEELNQPDMTYLDADMFFFSDPEQIFRQIGDRSIGITPHYFPPQYKYLERNGKYCVSIVHFKNSEVGRKCLSTWAQQCREWCKYENAGPGKFADQGYLDEWPVLYGKEVAEIIPGAALAPWNLSRYDISEVSHAPFEPDEIWADDDPVIAMHFHEYIHQERLTNYPLRDCDRELIYKPYIAAVKAAKERIAMVSAAGVAD